MSHPPSEKLASLAYETQLRAANARGKFPPKEADNTNTLLAETDHFYAIVGTGALVPGYVLVLPKTPYASFSAIPAIMQEEGEWFTQSLRTLLAETYAAPIAQFEHGLAEGGGEPAHLHLLPLAAATSAEDVITAINQTLHERAIGIAKVTTRRGDVLTNPCDIASILDIIPTKNIDGALLQYPQIALPPEQKPTASAKQQIANTHGHYIHFEVPELNVAFLTHETLRSQVSREICARALAAHGHGTGHEWNYEKFLHPEHMIQTMRDIAPALAALSISGKGDHYGFKTYLYPEQVQGRISDHASSQQRRHFG